MKVSFQKLRPKDVRCGKYKDFCYQNFRDGFMSELSKEHFGINSLEWFIDTCENVLNKHAS